MKPIKLRRQVQNAGSRSGWRDAGLRQIGTLGEVGKIHRSSFFILPFSNTLFCLPSYGKIPVQLLYSRLPINFKQSLNLTHFCRIPLVTRVSLPQILEPYSRLQTDPISAVIPKAAFTHPANLHLTLGELSLPTLSHVEDALELLKSSIARQVDRPLTVHVVGIGKSLVSRNPRDLSSMLMLFSRIEHPTNSLGRFCQGVH